MPLLAQHLIVLLAVAAAAVYLGWMGWKAMRGSGNCGCGKGSCARMDDVKRRLETAGQGRRYDARTGNEAGPGKNL